MFKSFPSIHFSRPALPDYKLELPGEKHGKTPSG
jgi:hypothetical protein